MKIGRGEVKIYAPEVKLGIFWNRGADVTLTYGRRYGFVGRNGLGKTTVLKMISEKQLM